MFTITARNVNHALPTALKLLAWEGELCPSRNGSVTRLPMPVATTYTHPRERILFDPDRNANPFFHFFEALWILAGREDVQFLEVFVGRMRDFSDDGKVFHGAYGKRLRPQLDRLCNMLRDDQNTRRAVLQIWEHGLDLGFPSKDLPCNMIVAFRIEDGNKLNMTVFNRSNDVLWGAYGANVVQFSMLQEYIAARSSLEVGWYMQISNDFHVYEWNEFWQFYKKRYGAASTRTTIDPYSHMQDLQLLRSLHELPEHAPLDNFATPAPLFAEPAFDKDLQGFFEVFDGKRNHYDFVTNTFNTIVCPMWEVWISYKERRWDHGLRMVQQIAASDWRTACQFWLIRAKQRASIAKVPA